MTLATIEGALQDAEVASRNAVKIADSVRATIEEVNANLDLPPEGKQVRVERARARAMEMVEAEHDAGREAISRAREALTSTRQSFQGKPEDRERVRTFQRDGLSLPQIASRAASQADSALLDAVLAEVPYQRRGDGPRRSWADPEPLYQQIAMVVLDAKAEGAELSPTHERLAVATLNVGHIEDRLRAATILGDRAARGDAKGAALARIRLGHIQREAVGG